MEVLRKIVAWYVQHKNDIDFIKDVIFVFGVVATFHGYFKFLGFLAQRGMLNKRQEMENDVKLYDVIYNKLKGYVDHEASQSERCGIGIRLLFIKNYPYKLDDDGYPQQLYYYFLSKYHEASGYISGKGLYVMEDLWARSKSVYYNPRNKKWFVDDKGLAFKKYQELEHKQLVRRIPFANIYGCDFNSDWSEKGEPVFYTKYKYYKPKLFADELVPSHA
jgi:hypothetical protein